jgi:hypothetical protein
MKTIVFTNARDEYLINEWIAHYILLGFTKIYIYDHLSIKPIKETAKIFIDSKQYKDRINIQRVDRLLFQKSKVYLNSFIIAKEQGYDWCLYVDADEFLYLKNFDNIEDYIKWYSLSKPNAIQIGIPWVMFGSNGHNLPPEKDILSNFVKSAEFNNIHIKVLCNVKNMNLSNVPISEPHYIKFNNYLIYSFLSDFSDFNKTQSWKFDNKYNSLTLDVYIAHYQNQSYQTYLERKVYRDNDNCPNRRFPNYQQEYFHKIFNDINNFGPRDKYANKIQNLLVEIEIENENETIKS